MPRSTALAPPVSDEVEDDGAASVVSERPETDVKRMRTKKYNHCLVCNTPTDSADWPPQWVKTVKNRQHKEGPGCLRCYKTWVGGNYLITHAKHGEFWSFCTWIESHKDEKAKFNECTKVREGTAVANFFPGEVVQTSDGGFTASRKYVGLTKAQFVQAFGKSPEELGLKMKDLVNELGQRFKGIVMVHPQEPWVQYEQFRTFGALRNSYRMCQTTKLQEDQDEKVHHSLLDELRKKGMSQHLRLCTATFDEVKKLCDDAAPSRGNHDGFSESEDDEGEEHDDGAGGESTHGAALAEADVVGPVLGQGSIAADDPMTSKRKKPASPAPRGLLQRAKSGTLLSAPGTPPMRSGASVESATRTVRPSARASAAGEVETASAAEPESSPACGELQKHLARCDLGAIWRGDKLGVQLRFAAKYAGDIVEADPSGHYELMEAINKAKRATEIMEVGVMKMERSILDQHLEKLVELDAHFPGVIQFNLVRRRAADLSEMKGLCSVEGATALLRVCTPWHINDDGSLTDAPFDPLHPIMASVDAAAMDKASFFRDAMSSKILSPLLKLGKPMEDKVVSVCSAALSHFSDLEYMPDEYVDTMASMLTCWRGLLTLLDPCNIDGMQEALDIIKARQTESADSPQRAISIMLHNIPHYRTVVNDFMKNKPTEAVMATFNKAKDICTSAKVPQAASLITAVQSYASIKHSLRAALEKSMVLYISDAAKVVFEDFKRSVETAGDTPIEMDELEAQINLYDLCNSNFEYEKLPAQDMLDFAQRVKQTRLDEVAITQFEQALASCTVNALETFGEGDFKLFEIAGTVRVALSAVDKPRVGLDAAVSEVLAWVAKVGFEHGPTLTTALRGADEWVSLPGTTVQDQIKTSLKAFICALEFHCKMATFNEQHRGVEDKMQADLDDVELRAFAASLAECNDMLPACDEKSKEYLVGVVETWSCELDPWQGAAANRALAAMRVAMAVVTESTTAEITAERSWTHGLADDCGWAAFHKKGTDILLRMDGDAMQRANTALKLRVAAAVKLFEAFGMVLDPMNDAKSLVLHCDLAAIEAHFLLAFDRYKDDTGRLKRLAKDEKDKVKNYNGNRDRFGDMSMHPAMAAKVEDLIQMRKS